MNDNATSEGVHLRWIHFREEIVSSFELLLNNEDFADVTLSCDGRQVRAHKVILSSCSPYFRDLFKNNPCQHPIVILQDVPFDTLNSLLLFIYCGEVEVNHRSLPEFLKIASTLKIKGLTSDPKNSSNHKIDINNMNTVCDESADQDKLDSICQESQFTCAPDNDKTDSGTMNANLDLGPQINYCPSDVSEGQPFSVHIGTKLEPEEITIDEDIPESAHLQDSSKDAMCHDMFEDSQVEEYDLTTDYSPYDEEEAAATQVHKESQGDNSVLSSPGRKRFQNFNQEVKGDISSKFRKSVCPVCFKRITTENISRHMKNIHFSRGQVTCSICQRKYKNMGTLATHFYTVHKSRPNQASLSKAPFYTGASTSDGLTSSMQQN